MRIVLFLIIGGLVIAGVSTSGAQNSKTLAATMQSADCNCVSVRRIRGENCGSPRSLRIEFRNVCDHSVNAQIYARGSAENARERVGGPTNLRPGSSSSYFWCQEPYEVMVACE